MIKSCLLAAALATMLPLSAATARPTPQEISAPAKNFESAAAAANALIRAHHYDPATLDNPAYRAMEAKVMALGRDAHSKGDFVAQFNALWRDGPFSHVVMAVARGSADDMAAYVDQMRVGKGAKLEWDGDVAVLTVNTMMGLDTIEQINAAYAEIADKKPRALIIDLRKNVGGAFAVRPLIEHLISKPFDAGAFTSRQWSAKHRQGPTLSQVSSLSPWDGWSVRAFWRDVTAAPVTRIRFLPSAPTYSGPVYGLISHRTASAAELAADALSASGRATLIGETTAGQMLSQKPFDLPDGLQLFVPIADYHAFKSGRIEGMGVKPDVAVAADNAMETALSRARAGG